MLKGVNRNKTKTEEKTITANPAFEAFEKTASPIRTRIHGMKTKKAYYAVRC